MQQHYLGRFVVLALAAASSSFAQPRALSAADYARAEKFMNYNTAPLIFRGGVRPAWLADGRFWYRVTTPEGSEFMLGDPQKGTRAPAFDHAKLATALSAAAATKYEASKHAFTAMEFSPQAESLSCNADRKPFVCDVHRNQSHVQGNA